MGDKTRILQRETEAARVLRDQRRDLIGEDDEDALRDTIEGETELKELIAAVLGSIAGDIAHLEGIKLHKATLAEREARLKNRVMRGTSAEARRTWEAARSMIITRDPAIAETGQMAATSGTSCRTRRRSLHSV